MDVELTRLPTGSAAWLALVNFTLTLGDLSEVDWLELKGTLPFAAKGDRKRSAVTLARAVLGLANRSPVAAERHLGGHGVVLVGIQDKCVVGAEEVDGAVLGDALQPYVGDDGPRWDYNYVHHPDGLVLALVVDPPQWGDPIHACRKEYSAEDGGLSVRDGDVFVRIPGKTRRATSSDLANLQERRERSPIRGAQVSVEYDETFDHVDTSSVLAIIHTYIERTADELFGSLQLDPTGDPLFGGKLGASLAALRGGHQSPGEFEADVERWRAEAQAAAPRVAEDFYRYELARGHFSIRNESDRYLEAVRVQAHFPPGVHTLAESDAEWCEHRHGFHFAELLPQPPREWGSTPRSMLGVPFPPDLQRNIVRAPHPFDVAQTDEGTVVTWFVGDLRPRSTELGVEDKFAVVTDNHQDDVVVHWRVTAKGVDHVFEGEFRIRCAQQDHARLSWVAPNAQT